MVARAVRRFSTVRPSHHTAAAGLLLLAGFAVLLPVVAFDSPPESYEWENSTWRHRVGMHIQTNAEMENWTVERRFNFTALLQQENDTGAFDEDSVRVFEYNDDGSILQEVPSQFDPLPGYDVADNAVGEVVFTLNGTTPIGTNRTFFVYYDSQQHGPKPAPSYSSDLFHVVNGKNLTVSTVKANYTIETARKDNTSGISLVFHKQLGSNVVNPPAGSRAAEYIEYTNGTHPFTFNLSGNFSVRTGPVRLTVTQRGYQEAYNVSDGGNTWFVKKEYRFYENAGPDTPGFVKVEHSLENVDSTGHTLRSTHAGALAFDSQRSLTGGGADPQEIFDYNTTDPYSWVMGGQQIFVGLLNLNESRSEYIVNWTNTTTNQDISDVGMRIGANLSSVSVAAGETVSQTTLFSPGYDFGTSEGRTEFIAGLAGGLGQTGMVPNQPSVFRFGTETWNGSINGSSNRTVYNRGEAVELQGNVTADPYELTAFVNATLNMNTSVAGDDETVILANTSAGFEGVLWNGTYAGLNNTSAVGTWRVNVSSFTEDGLVLATDFFTFSVSDAYVANITLRNTIEVAGLPMFANVSVENVREDRNITGANISCRYDGSTVHPDNITERGNGLYSLNFTAPAPADTYALWCNATKSGNLGDDNVSFRTEVAKVVPNTTFVPLSLTASNVVLRQGEGVEFRVNVSNNESGTASDVNVSVFTPPGWTPNVTSQDCGDLLPAGNGDASFCTKPFSVDIPAGEEPSNYTVNATTVWTNPDDTLNSTNETLPVEVEKTHRLNVFEPFVNGSVPAGFSRFLGNYTIESLGNDNLTNITYTCAAGTVCQNFSVSFLPVNVSTLEEGSNATVNVTVGVPRGFPPSTYNGTVNVTSDDDFDTVNLSVRVVPDTTVDTDTVPSTFLVADSITLADNQTLGFDANATNTGEAIANHTNATIALPTVPVPWMTNRSQPQQCGTLDPDQFCVRDWFVTVPNATNPGLYSVVARTNWTNPNGSERESTHTVTVNVTSNPVQRVNESFLNATVPASSEARIGNVTVESIGNDNLTDVNASCSGGEVCANFSVEFTPSLISQVNVSFSRLISVNVTIPPNFEAGNYTGFMNVSSSGGEDNITMNVEVPATRSWEIDQQTCQGTTVNNVTCTRVLNNTGNVPVNISVVNITAKNGTDPKPFNVSVPIGGTTPFDMTFNTSKDPSRVYEAEYNVSSFRPSLVTWRRLNVTIFPSVDVPITLLLDPAVSDRNDVTRILANVTTTTQFNISGANVTVQTPAGVNHTTNMTRLREFGSTSTWQLFYPNESEAGANTSFKGNYTAFVSAEDGVGNSNTNSSGFLVTAKMFDRVGLVGNVTNLTQGSEDIDIRYNLRNLVGTVGGASVNLTVYNPQNFRIAEVEDGNPYTTASGGRKPGYIDPPPSFDVGAQDLVGLYELYANATWLDTDINYLEEVNERFTFAVERHGELEVDWDIGETWYADANLTGYLAFHDDGTLDDPDAANLTIFLPNGSEYRSFDLANMHRQTRGVYKANTTVESDPVLGTYWARVMAVDEGDVTVEFQSFRMTTEEVATGPFDIRLDLLEQQVAQGDYLDFNITLVNQGNESGDVKVSYWTVTQGSQYQFISETVFAPAHTNLTIPRNIFIYDSQPTGTSVLNAKVEPLESGLFLTATANHTFEIVAQNDTTPEQPDPIIEEETETRVLPREEPDEEEVVSNVSIVDAPRSINLVRGRPAFKAVAVANTGDTTLNNVSMNLVGVPPSWVTITPADLTMQTQTVETFSVEIAPPESADLRTYNGTFLVTSDRDTASMAVSVRVFQSLEEKVRADIVSLRTLLDDLRNRTAALEAEGVDVSGVTRIMADMEDALASAEESLDAGDTDAALQEVSEAESLSNDAGRLLRRLQPPERRQVLDYLPLVIGGLLLVGLVLVVVYMVRVRGVDPVEVTRHRIRNVLYELKRRQRTETDELQQEKQKTKRLLRLLEAQHDEGIMTDETYQELKQSAQQKLKRINRKLES